MKRSSAILGLILLTGGAVVLGLTLSNAPPVPVPPPSPPPEPSPPGEPPVAAVLPLPPCSETRFLNTGPDSRHIGSATCARCHPGNHTSYLLTAHSKALGNVNPVDEPPDGAFEHKPSGRTYRVYRRGGELWHEEVLRAPEGKEIARTEQPVRFRIGSGHFTRSYLIEIDGFLYESPITWYASKGKWDVSPGYDTPNHLGFDRAVGSECVSCHVGRWERLDGSTHRLNFPEKAIGCESCHGPGSRHQEFHLAHKLAPGEPDLTIVHPGNLSRPLLDSVCASCHLSTTASIHVRGRRVGDYRPGLPLSDFRLHYALTGETDQMTVVGHVDQLRQSACYQKSGGRKSEMTCVTCHDPHAKAKPADPVAFYRQKCIDCHAKKPCGLPPAERLKQNPADNCAACHMPRGDTEIPHVAFTHHRIGRHAKQPPLPPSDTIPDLVALDDNPLLGEPDRKRNLGLAYSEASRLRTSARFAGVYRERARANLRAAYLAGARDAETTFALAELAALGGDMAAASRFAREALGTADLRPEDRVQCLRIVALGARDAGDPTAAADAMEQVVRLRRNGEDWGALGLSYLDLKKFDKARAALHRALVVSPFDFRTHFNLASCYRELGDDARANEYLETGQWLQRKRQPRRSGNPIRSHTRRPLRRTSRREPPRPRG